MSREKRFGASCDMGGGSGVRRSFASIWSSLDEEAEEAAALERFAGILMAMIGSCSAADLVRLVLHLGATCRMAQQWTDRQVCHVTREKAPIELEARRSENCYPTPGRTGTNHRAHRQAQIKQHKPRTEQPSAGRHNTASEDTARWREIRPELSRPARKPPVA